MEPAGTSPTIFSSEPRSATEFAALVDPVVPGMSGEQIDQLLQYRDMLHARNQRVNLTAVRDFDGIERRLILESLRLVPVMKGLTPENGNVMDLGSGGGIPGVILAIAMPGCSFTLLDATGKKVLFQREVIEGIGLGNVRAVQGRAEELGHDINWRNTFDAVSARAVTSLSALMELGLPFVSMKGWLVLPKGVEIEDELGIARKAAGKLGGTIVSHDVIEDAGSDVDTRLVLVRKDQATPSEYPRRVGLPARSPLGSPQDQANAKGKQRKRGN
jgi:16S rRNA (guanine527-N7)-methyltransferase